MKNYDFEGPLALAVLALAVALAVVVLALAVVVLDLVVSGVSKSTQYELEGF